MAALQDDFEQFNHAKLQFDIFYTHSTLADTYSLVFGPRIDTTAEESAVKAPEDEDEKLEWEVEAVLVRRRVRMRPIGKDGRQLKASWVVQYRVQWKGYWKEEEKEEKEDWITKEDAASCAELIAKFEDAGKIDKTTGACS